MRKTVKMAPFANVISSGIATLNCPVGLTYNKIVLQTLNGTAADIKRIELEANGRNIMTFEKGGAQVNELNTFYKRVVNAGFVTLYFNRPELQELVDQRLLGLGTADISTLTIKVTLASGLAADFDLIATAKMSEPMAMGAITKIRSFPKTFATGGELDIDSLPLGGARIAAIHLKKSGADISKARVLVNNAEVYEASAAVNAQDLQEEGRNAVANDDYFHIDFMAEGDLAQALITQGVQDLRIKPTLGGAGQVDVLVEYIDGLNGAA